MEKLTDSLFRKGISKDELENINNGRLNEKKGIRKLFMEELKEMYWVEDAVVKLLHKMHKHADSYELSDELIRQLEVVKGQQVEIEKVFDMFDEKVVAVKSRTMEGLIEEAELLMGETKKGVVRDAGIISWALKIKHLETATYETLCFYARILGEEMATGLLQISLSQESLASEKLSQLTESIRFGLVNTKNAKGSPEFVR